MQDIFESYKKSIDRLAEILKEPKTIANRDSAIQRFEFTTELAWKSAQKFLYEKGIDCRSPKDCLKESFKYGLLEDNPLWLKIIEDRNITVHTYDENDADQIYDRLSQYFPLFGKLKETLNQEINK